LSKKEFKDIGVSFQLEKSSITPGSNLGLDVQIRYDDACFDGNTLIKMMNGTKKKAKNIKLNDVVMSRDGKGYKVKKIVSNTKDKIEKNMVNINNFWITRGHPILHNNDWYRPDELYKTEFKIVENGLYNFVLEGNEKTVIVGGNEDNSDDEVICCTLGSDTGRLIKLYPEQHEKYCLLYNNNKY